MGDYLFIFLKLSSSPLACPSYVKSKVKYYGKFWFHIFLYKLCTHNVYILIIFTLGVQNFQEC